jgi:predicted RNase H-related nuclease YkuK (DUF458 family)
MAIKNEYPPFTSWEWKSYDGKNKVDVAEWVQKNLDATFYVGTDSQNYRKGKRLCVFTTVLIAYRKGKGGSVILHSDKTPYMEHLRQRLLIEAMRSLETAWWLQARINPKDVVTIHLDVNENLKYKSAQYKEELVGMVIAQGFNAAWKPNSWAASGVADAKT